MSGLSFPEIKIDCINLSLKHHYISLEHKSKCYESQKYAISRSVDSVSLKASQIPNKNSIALRVCLTVLLPLPDYNSMTFKCNIYCCSNFHLYLSEAESMHLTSNSN